MSTFPAVTAASPANIRAAAFLGVYIRQSGGKWQTLGSIADGILNYEGFESDDSLGRNRGNGAGNFTAKCQMKQTSLVELELLDSICSGLNDFLFKLSEGVTPAGAASVGWVQVNAASVGVKANLVCDGTPEQDRYIELEWQGSIVMSDTTQVALFKPTLAAADFEATGTGGTYHAIGIYTAATDGGNPDNTHLKPCGVQYVYLADDDEAGDQAILPIQNVKMNYEMLAATDGIRRFLPNSMAINIEYDWMASDNADLLLLNTMVNRRVNVTIVMVDNIQFLLSNQVGIKTNFEVSGDMDKNRVVRFTHRGRVLQSSFDGIVSQL